MSARKKYNGNERLKRNMKGSFISFDGNEEHSQTARTAQGVPFDGVMLNYVVSYPFRWKVEISFVFKHGDLLKVVNRELELDQQIKLDEITPHILGLQTLVGLELGDYWEFSQKKWRATIV